MLNIFVNSTTFGQAMGATFDMNAEGNLAQKRLTDQADCEVLTPIYERQIEAEKISALLIAGDTKKLSGLGKAVETENIRVNSLNVLIRELTFIASLETDEMIIAYVPSSLLQELESGRIKFYLTDESETTYYSGLELSLWKEALPLIQHLYCRLVFKNIENCKRNQSNTPIQADRVNIYGSMYGKLLTAYREMKLIKKGAEGYQATGTSAF